MDDVPTFDEVGAIGAVLVQSHSCHPSAQLALNWPSTGPQLAGFTEVHTWCVLLYTRGVYTFCMLVIGVYDLDIGSAG